MTVLVLDRWPFDAGIVLPPFQKANLLKRGARPGRHEAGVSQPVTGMRMCPEK